MIRRVFLVVAAALALILAPTVAATAYNAPGFSCTVSDPTPAVGASVTVVCSGADAGEVLTLTVGTTQASATANASGVATFTFTATSAGGFTIVVKGANGAVISTQTITVAAAGAASGPVKGGLASTGFDGMPIALGGGVLVLLGAGAVVVARRRKSQVAA